jgi:hypothetical protein
VQLQSRAVGEHVYHPAGAHPRRRDANMSATSSGDWYDALAWLYGGTGLDSGDRQRIGAEQLVVAAAPDADVAAGGPVEIWGERGRSAASPPPRSASMVA